MKDGWIKVDGVHEVPVGEWLVTTDGFGRESKAVHVCSKDEKVAIIGGHFEFDMPDVIAYMPCPTAYES